MLDPDTNQHHASCTCGERVGPLLNAGMIHAAFDAHRRRRVILTLAATTTPCDNVHCQSEGRPVVPSQPPAGPDDQPAVSVRATCSPERSAPSMYPAHTVAVSVPAQWIRPHGSRSADPNWVSTPGGRCAP